MSFPCIRQIYKRLLQITTGADAFSHPPRLLIHMFTWISIFYLLSAAFLLISGFTMKITKRSPIRVTTAAVQNTDFTPFWISATLVGSAAVLALYATANTATAIVPES